MFGLGFGKLVVLVVLVLAVWYGYKYIGRVEEVRQSLRRAQQAAEKAARRGRETTRIEAEDMVPCRVCGAYVASRGAGRCGRSDCPW